MFTRNWSRLLAAFISENSDKIEYKSVTGASNRVSGANNTFLRLGAAGMADAAYLASLYKVRTSYGTHGGVVIGTGTTPPTADDYALSGDIISTFSASASVERFNDENGAGVTATYMITNTGTSDFTIGEIGLIANISHSTYSSSTNTLKALLERTVLDAPVTIPAGGIGQVVYTIRVNYPT